MPTAISKSRLRSGSAHCDLELAVEVRQCPLGSGARGGGPAVPTGIWTARRRTRRRWRRRRRRRRTALIKSNNPHLAGGEYIKIHSSLIDWLQFCFSRPCFFNLLPARCRVHRQGLPLAHVVPSSSDHGAFHIEVSIGAGPQISSAVHQRKGVVLENEVDMGIARKLGNFQWRR